MSPGRPARHRSTGANDADSAPAVRRQRQVADQAAGSPPETGNLILRNDTILGVCEAIGQDFGFNPNFLRIPLAGGVLISPLASFGIYFALGLAVLASRLLFPAPRQLAAAAPQPPLSRPRTAPTTRPKRSCSPLNLSHPIDKTA